MYKLCTLCFTGNPAPEVKWFKAGDSVKAGERITLTTADDTFTLEITNALESDGGTYTLTAHNSQGTIFSDVLVTVSIPPSVGPSDDEIRYVPSLLHFFQETKLLLFLHCIESIMTVHEFSKCVE
jgi:TusA-related sulfurtransferase